MPPPKPRSAKLPLLIALPVLLVIGVVAVFLIPNDPPPQPQPPAPIFANEEPGPGGDDGDPLVTDPNPRPRPNPKPGSPTEVAVAKAMEDEIDAAMEAIRARLELKFKYAEYVVDRTWTLEQVVRRVDTLNGKYFNATDYTLGFPEGENPVAIITCATIQGDALPDGALSMTVNLRTGKSSREGRVLARTTDGYVLLGDAEYRYISEVLREAAQSHVIAQAGTASGLAGLDTSFGVPAEAAFEAADFTAGAVKGAPLSAEFACRSIRGEPLAEPAVVTINYATRTATLSAVRSSSWMEAPDNRDQFMRDCRWMMREVASGALQEMAEGIPATELTPEEACNQTWTWNYVAFLPFDVKLTFDKDNPQRVVLEVATCFGRPLPFAAVRYVADSSTGTYAFEG
jgi:hypothetical protein